MWGRQGSVESRSLVAGPAGPPPRPLHSPKLRRLLLSSPGAPPTGERGRRLEKTGALRASGASHEGPSGKTGKEWGDRPLGSACGPPLTSVCPYVGLETVVILVFLAADSTLIGPWNKGEEGTRQPALTPATTRPRTRGEASRHRQLCIKGAGLVQRAALTLGGKVAQGPGEMAQSWKPGGLGLVPGLPQLAERRWASHFPSLGLHFQMCKKETVTSSANSHPSSLRGERG